MTTLALAGCATGIEAQDDVPDVADAGVDRPDATVDPSADAAAPPADASPSADAAPPIDGGAAAPPAVVLLIGDGMGPGQLEAASLYRYGEAGALHLQTLPSHGQLLTASLSGTTDSAAASTALATGAKTYNGRIGLDRSGATVTNLVEVAHQHGLAAGVVTTAALPHATPAGFTAHTTSRDLMLDIADQQALTTRPEVMLGGGWQYFAPAGDGSLRTDDGLIAPLEADGYQVITSSVELDAATGSRLVGLFAPEHLDYSLDRPPDTTQPTLAEMTVAALDRLSDNPAGFFLVVEGGRIDMASHGNDLARTVGEVLAFDDAVDAVQSWAEGREVTILVTADHESGGLHVVTPEPAGTLPEVTWRWGDHTNARVDLYGAGPGAELFAGQLRDPTWVHAAIEARLTDSAVVPPPTVLTADGHLADLRYRAVDQTAATGFGAGFNQLDALYLDADRNGLAIGIEGLFEWDHNAIAILIDVDYGAATGFAQISGAISDASGRVDSIVAALPFQAPTVTGFGADFALVAFGGADPHLEDLIDDAGLRGLVAPTGDPANLWWYGVATNFGEGVRAGTTPLSPTPGEGFEAIIPWTELYPGSGGGVPPGATLAIAAVLVNDGGGYASNQALPPFPAGTDNPGSTPVALPGVVRFQVDSDDDGIADGDQAPSAP